MFHVLFRYVHIGYRPMHSFFCKDFGFDSCLVYFYTHAHKLEVKEVLILQPFFVTFSFFLF